MAYSYHVNDQVGTNRLSASIEEFDLSSFGESLAAASVVELTDGGVLLETRREFPNGILVRIDFYPPEYDDASDEFDEVVAVGVVRESREIVSGNLYRLFVAFAPLKSDHYRQTIEGLENW
jgi:hypothetical protein